MTHELRTPLTTLRLYSDLLTQGAVPPDEQRTYLQTMQQESDRLGRLIENVLSFSHVEHHGQLPLETLDLVSFIREMLPQWEHLLGSYHSQLRFIEPDDAVQVLVKVHRSSLEHVCSNLLDNAGKYAPGAIEIAIAAATNPDQLTSPNRTASSKTTPS